MAAPGRYAKLVSRSQTASSPPFLHNDVIGRGRHCVKMEGRKRSGYARLMQSGHVAHFLVPSSDRNDSSMDFIVYSCVPEEL